MVLYNVSYPSPSHPFFPEWEGLETSSDVTSIIRTQAMEDIPDILGDINSCLPVADFGISDPEDVSMTVRAEIYMQRSTVLQLRLSSFIAT